MGMAKIMWLGEGDIAPRLSVVAGVIREGVRDKSGKWVYELPVREAGQVLSMTKQYILLSPSEIAVQIGSISKGYERIVYTAASAPSAKPKQKKSARQLSEETVEAVTNVEDF